MLSHLPECLLPSAGGGKAGVDYAKLRGFLSHTTNATMKDHAFKKMVTIARHILERDEVRKVINEWLIDDAEPCEFKVTTFTQSTLWKLPPDELVEVVQSLRRGKYTVAQVQSRCAFLHHRVALVQQLMTLDNSEAAVHDVKTNTFDDILPIRLAKARPKSDEDYLSMAKTLLKDWEDSDLADIEANTSDETGGVDAQGLHDEEELPRGDRTGSRSGNRSHLHRDIQSGDDGKEKDKDKDKDKNKDKDKHKDKQKNKQKRQSNPKKRSLSSYQWQTMPKTELRKGQGQGSVDIKDNIAHVCTNSVSHTIRTISTMFNLILISTLTADWSKFFAAALSRFDRVVFVIECWSIDLDLPMIASNLASTSYSIKSFIRVQRAIHSVRVHLRNPFIFFVCVARSTFPNADDLLTHFEVKIPKPITADNITQYSTYNVADVIPISYWLRVFYNLSKSPTFTNYSILDVTPRLCHKILAFASLVINTKEVNSINIRLQSLIPNTVSDKKIIQKLQTLMTSYWSSTALSTLQTMMPKLQCQSPSNKRPAAHQHSTRPSKRSKTSSTPTSHHKTHKPRHHQSKKAQSPSPPQTPSVSQSHDSSFASSDSNSEHSDW